MMKSPFKNIDDAFSPMYDEQVVVETKNGIRQTLNVFVAVDNTSDPFVDEMMETNREDIIINPQRGDWCFINEKIERGDKITRLDFFKRKYVVQDVTYDELMGLIIKARSSK